MLEILAPAGNLECAKAAIGRGANAVYAGLSSFSARQSADNFDESAFRALLSYAHLCGVKVYVAMNTVVKSSEMEGYISTLLSAWNMGADAIIVQDIFLGKWIKERYPEIILHLSTQAGVCTVEGASLAKEYGFSRVILARETPLAEIAKIAKIIETEVFVQGALCTAFSGQCYFSSFVGGNSGNRGRCKQPCRKQYSYDRNGNEEKSYALSLSDLSVGEDIEKLITAGVLSFKIEGRMRRAEYVGAAVGYYRQLLDEKKASAQSLSELKRTYNRGNYTKGLAFGQDKRLLSTAIQGHIGEKVGVVKIVNGKFFVESVFKPKQGDAFKILREGKEVGGASYFKAEGRGFLLQSQLRLKNGDGVFVTTDTAANERAIATDKQGRLRISLSFVEGELPKAICGSLEYRGDTPLQSAENRPLTAEELRLCFQKTDGLPAEILFDNVEVTGDIFIPKSELNAFRRAFYAKLLEGIERGENKGYEYMPITLSAMQGRNEKTAVIANDFQGVSIDIAIYKADDLFAPPPVSFVEGKFEKYIYYPAFATAKDLERIAELCKNVDGIYAENYSGVAFAKTHKVKLFAGVGFHLINPLSIGELLKESCLAYYALSKEGNAEELSSLVDEKAFVLSAGDIKLMDLCYCPFAKTCSVCDKREIYRLTDEGGRVFPVRRYLAADGACRFEVYNCATLIGLGIKNCGKLLDLSVIKDKAAFATADESGQKKLCSDYTSGHYKRGVL